MPTIPRDRVYFEFHHFRNSISARQSLSANAIICTIRICSKPQTSLPGIKIVSTLDELLNLIRQSGIGKEFSGSFMIKDVRHHNTNMREWNSVKEPTIAPPAQTRQYTIPRQSTIIQASNRPATVSRLPPNTPQEIKAVQQFLLNAGYSKASFSLG